jgi:hypothetical protein
MEWLNEYQINQVNDALAESGVTHKALQEDLLDHVCCIIEEKIDEGLSFHEGLEYALNEFGVNQLPIIQEATLYLINSKYNIMKKTIGITGLITSLMVILGVIFKILHYPGTGILLVLGILGISFIVFPLLAYLSLKTNTGSSTKAANMAGYVAGFLISIGTLFKIMHWPMAMIILWLGVLAMLVVFMPLYTLNSYKMAENKLLALSKSMLIVAAIAVLWGLSSIRNSNDITFRQQNIEQSK